MSYVAVWAKNSEGEEEEEALSSPIKASPSTSTSVDLDQLLLQVGTCLQVETAQLTEASLSTLSAQYTCLELLSKIDT